ncbi:MAG: atsA 8 [Segetibacter sp.]|jgi:arylsulfatase A-like enzyme|nr:atsA 8 [Segetibacter sp.]
MSVLDFIPTICALTGTKVPATFQVDGYDRSEILLGRIKGNTNHMYWYYPNKPLPGKTENISPVLAVRSGKWKFLMEADGSNQQLYNLEKDHRETKNVFKEEKKITQQLYLRLITWYQQNVKDNKS